MEGAEGRPLLVLDRRGKGRVALLTSDHAWLWARGFEGGGPHTDLLRRLSHWLMKEPDLEEERLIASARGLKLTIERRTLENTTNPVTISAPGGERSEVTLEQERPGVWKSTVDVKIPGLYKVETEGPSGLLTAVANAGVEDPREMSEVVATQAKLKPIVDQTGGGQFWTRTSTGQRHPTRSSCRASPCCRTPRCWPDRAGWACATARPSSRAASSSRPCSRASCARRAARPHGRRLVARRALAHKPFQPAGVLLGRNAFGSPQRNGITARE